MKKKQKQGSSEIVNTLHRGKISGPVSSLQELVGLRGTGAGGRGSVPPAKKIFFKYVTPRRPHPDILFYQIFIARLGLVNKKKQKPIKLHSELFVPVLQINNRDVKKATCPLYIFFCFSEDTQNKPTFWST